MFFKLLHHLKLNGLMKEIFQWRHWMFEYTACISFKSFYFNQQVKAEKKNHHLYVNVFIKLRCNGITWLIELLCSFIAECFYTNNITCHVHYLIWEILILWIWYSKILKCRLRIIVFRYFKLYILHEKA